MNLLNLLARLNTNESLLTAFVNAEIKLKYALINLNLAIRALAVVCKKNKCLDQQKHMDYLKPEYIKSG